MKTATGKLLGRLALTLACALALLPTLARDAHAELSGAGTETAPYVAGSWADLQTALDAGGWVELRDGVTAPQDVESLTVPADKTVTLDLNGFTLNGSGAKKATTILSSYPSTIALYVAPGGDLTVKDSVGTGVVTGRGSYGVYVDNGSYPDYKATHFTLLSGTISGNGVGVFVEAGGTGTEGTFTMSGGVISGNGLAGVKTSSGESVRVSMNGGTISGNGLENGGIGGVHMMGGTFNMSGGVIRGNGGTYGGVGLIPSVDVSFNMSGGTITENMGSVNGGVYVGVRDGGQYNASPARLRVSGTAQITGNMTDGLIEAGTLVGGSPGNVFLTTGTGAGGEARSVVTVVGALETGAAIGVTASYAAANAVVAQGETGMAGYAPYTLTESDAAKLRYDADTYDVMFSGGEAVLGSVVSTWEALQNALNAGGHVRLSADVSAPASERLTVPGSVSATLDLCGHAIVGNDKEPDHANRKPVLRIDGGSLTIEDSGSATTRYGYWREADAAGGRDGYGRNKYYVLTETQPNSDDYDVLTGGVIAGGSGVGSMGTGGGVSLNAGTLTINGGTIAGNADCGVYATESALIMNGGRIVGNYTADEGAGVCIKGGTFTMNGGTIDDNTAAGDGGGGVAAWANTNDEGGTFTMTGGTIRGNTAQNGGGVYVTVVQVWDHNASFTMTGGTVAGNSAEYCGGGVFVNKGTFDLRSGTISENIAGKSGESDVGGGGVYVCYDEDNPDNTVFKLSGDPVVTGNMVSGAANNVYLPENRVVTVAGALSNTTPVGLTMAAPGTVTSGWSTYMSSAEPTDCFTSDDSAYVVTASSGEAALAALYAVTFTAPDNGTLSVTANGSALASGDRVAAGTEVTATAAPAAGYSLGNLTVGGVDVASMVTENAYRFSIAGDTAIAAAFTANAYTVAFDGNGATGGTMEPQSFTYGTAQALAANAFTRSFTVTYAYDGATGGNDAASATADAAFAGWATSASGGAVYADGQELSNLAAEADATVRLYAVWTDGSVTLPTPVKRDYAFDGWYGSEALTARVGAGGASYTPEQDIILYAKWTELDKVLTPAFSLAGGSYIGAQSVTITCATEGAAIWYTTDGSEPTTGGTLYAGAIELPVGTTTLKAIAVKEGMRDSDAATAAYTVTAPVPAGVTWTLENGQLLITGSGAMEDYSPGGAPWFARRAEIEYVSIGPGVTRVGAYAFYACGAIHRADIEGGGVSVGDRAFAYCCALREFGVRGAAGLSSIGEGGFYACFRLADRGFAGSATVGNKAFELCGLGG